MDNKKIGKLIADLRKKKGLTQQELGDKVGVGFRAVSKWERGLTLPDITILNQLSKILGISSDELLTGEVSKEHKNKKKISSKVKIILSTILIIIIVTISTFIYFSNKTYTYTIISNNDDYYVEGNLVLHQNDMIIVINKLEFLDKEFASLEFHNYDYKIMSNDEMLMGYGLNPNMEMIEETKTIANFSEKFSVNYSGGTRLSRNKLETNDFIININFLKSNNETVPIEIKCSLTSV